MTDLATLLAAARQATALAHAPRTGRPCGAALMADDGRIFAAGNLEIANYGSSVCAAKAALVNAWAAGARRFTALAVAGAGADMPYPCGDCLQALIEFAPHLLIISEAEPRRPVPIADLLPDAFGLG
ncbi:MAG: cytidine deaminase [Chloroflexaceae bacterium]